MPQSKKYSKVLTIAGSDSGGGAGIQADLKTISALEGYGMSVITAVTAQNTQGVTGIHGIPPSFIQQQIDAIFGDMGVDSVKIGMLHNSEVIQAIQTKLKAYEPQNIVLDPVMVAQSGDKLLADEAIQTLKNQLIPQAHCITPNLPEAEVLLKKQINDKSALKTAAKELLQMGCDSVLVKGGHLDKLKAIDYLATKKGEVKEFSTPKINTQNTHGTGCTLSSAIATFLAKGNSLTEAVSAAKSYMSQAIERGATYSLGKGSGPVHHFYDWWQ